MVQQVLQRFDFTYSSPQATPLSTRHSLSALPSDESVEPSGPYPELVGCLMYLMTCTRPDLAYPLSILARYVAPGRHRPEHMAVAKRVLRYLCSTSGMGLVLGGRSPVVLTGHANASWVDDLATQRSSQGYTFSLGSRFVSWRSTRSCSVLSSSCEAEIYAGAMAAQELRWLTYLLTDLGEPPRSPPVLYVDNKAMLALCRGHRLEHRTKHIALRYFLARELQQRGQLRLAYVASQANTSDIFSKALQPCDHQRFCTMLAGLVAVPSSVCRPEAGGGVGPSDPLVEAYFYPGQMYNYNQYNIFDEMLSDPHTDCYRFCAGYNSKLPADAPADVKAKYWMFEETCNDGNGGTRRVLHRILNTSPVIALPLLHPFHALLLTESLSRSSCNIHPPGADSSGICACYNANRCKDETSYTDDWMQPSRGDVATDDYEVPANFTVGALCLAVEKGDPHFTGADGSHFDFSGLPNHHFALISDAHLQVNGYFGGRFGTWGNATKALTWIRSLGIMFGHHTAVLHARNGSSADYGNGYLGRVTVNDRPVRVPAPGTSVNLWPGASLRWVKARLRSGDDLVDVYDLLITDMGTLRLTLRPEVKNLRTGDDGVVHFGIDVLGSTFSTAVHGVLGQTFRPDFHGRLYVGGGVGGCKPVVVRLTYSALCYYSDWGSWLAPLPRGLRKSQALVQPAAARQCLISHRSFPPPPSPPSSTPPYSANQELKYNPLLRANAVPGDNAEGFIDGSVEDYLVSDLLKADCRFCRFSRSPEVDSELAHALSLLRVKLPRKFFPQPWFGRKGKGKGKGKKKGKKAGMKRSGGRKGGLKSWLRKKAAGGVGSGAEGGKRGSVKSKIARLFGRRTESL
ncbi:unnamed protein product [Closterium sp. NIES-54]